MVVVAVGVVVGVTVTVVVGVTVTVGVVVGVTVTVGVGVVVGERTMKDAMAVVVAARTLRRDEQARDRSLDVLRETVDEWRRSVKSGGHVDWRHPDLTALLGVVSDRELAEILGVSRQRVHQVRTGRR